MKDVIFEVKSFLFVVCRTLISTLVKVSYEYETRSVCKLKTRVPVTICGSEGMWLFYITS